MAKWQRTLKLNPQMQAFRNGEITLKELSASVAEKLRKVREFGVPGIDEEREEIADAFDGLAEDVEADADDFDNVLARLYDWADSSLDDKWNGKKVCWADTIST